jgi:hypothetical protein
MLTQNSIRAARRRPMLVNVPIGPPPARLFV